ncbi:uncharacterized protein LOC135643716 [Musa acuminata AAA Group]|uniref:uncharacterized protein LOC135643716 n=1 Tax=Musa acuminata AAA Group TaxID=214697 RepID=UPI0031DA6891
MRRDNHRCKPVVAALVDEYENLRIPVAATLQEELARAAASLPPLAPHEATFVAPAPAAADDDSKEDPYRAVEDMLTLLYFGCLFDVEPQSGLRRRRWSKPKMPSFEPVISTRRMNNLEVQTKELHPG